MEQDSAGVLCHYRARAHRPDRPRSRLINARLEEAAGVSKFKTRKRLAEAKLESSRQNLN